MLAPAPPRADILVGDVFTELLFLPSNHFDCIVTSPPYWGLRDYGVEGQLGLEPTLEEYLSNLTIVFREARRVLKPAGTMWLVVGDCYAASPPGNKTVGVSAKSTLHGINGPSEAYRKTLAAGHATKRDTVKGSGLRAKNLCMIPNRLALALQADGWWVRSEIIWHKPNPMPESIGDRPTSCHEKIWLLTKSEKYFYDAAAIREPAVFDHKSGNGFKRDARLTYADENGAHGNEQQWTDVGGSRNARNVWTINSAPYREAHFATFPPALVERCLLAGCPRGGEVLDPFGGAGTTGLVAARLGINSTLIELNPAYAAMARARIDRG
jgi:DNA modification methylase